MDPVCLTCRKSLTGSDWRMAVPLVFQKNPKHGPWLCWPCYRGSLVKGAREFVRKRGPLTGKQEPPDRWPDPPPEEKTPPDPGGSLHFVIGQPGPSHHSGRFVELENEKGERVGVGTWREIDGLWHLVVPYPFNTATVWEKLRTAGKGLLAEVYVGDGKIVCAPAIVPHVRKIVDALTDIAAAEKEGKA